MNIIAKISHSCVEIQKVTKRLRTSFEKNVDLNALMSTIDPNCLVAIDESKQRAKEDGSPKGVVRVSY